MTASRTPAAQRSRSRSRHLRRQRPLPDRLRELELALLVEPGGATTLYTDFRYLEAAGAVDGSTSCATQRDVAGRSPSCSPGRVGFEAARMTYAQWETVGAGGADLVRDPRAWSRHCAR